jgi:O-antigen ligase
VRRWRSRGRLGRRPVPTDGGIDSLNEREPVRFMEISYLLILIGSLATTALITRFGVTRRWGSAISRRTGPSLLIFMAMGSLFIGANESGSTTSLAVDTPRIVRAIVLGFIFLVSVYGILTHPFSIRRAGNASRWMVLYSLLAMLSAVYSISPLVSLWKGFEVLSFVVMGVYLSRYLSTLDDIQWGIDLICVAMLYFSVSVIFSVIISPAQALPKSQGMSGSIITGAQSLVPAIYPNSVTQFAALLSCLTLCQVLSPSNNGGKTGLLCILGLGGIVLILGHSRTSLFGAFIALSVILILGRYIITAIIVGLFVLAGMLVGVGEILTSYILRGQTEQAFYGMTGRTYYWNQVWEVVLDSPLFGHGFYAQRIMLSVSSVDNTYLQILLGLGVVGLIVILVPLGIVAYRLYRDRPHSRTSGQEKVIWLQLVTIYIIIMMRSITGPTFQDFNINLVLIMLVILSATAFAGIKRASERTLGVGPEYAAIG